MGFDICSMEFESGSACMLNLLDEEVMSASQNPKKQDGRKKFKETIHPMYRGMRRNNPHKWVCKIHEPNKKLRSWLGTFPTAEMVACAHDVAMIAFRGQFGCLNFADSVWRLLILAPTTTKDI